LLTVEGQCDRCLLEGVDPLFNSLPGGDLRLATDFHVEYRDIWVNLALNRDSKYDQDNYGEDERANRGDADVSAAHSARCRPRVPGRR
jgi:hypothetical protein